MYKKRGKSYLSRSTSVPRLGLGGLRHKKRIEKSLSVNHIDNYRKRQYMFIFLILYQKNLAIASGATPIGSAVAHPIEERREVEANDKEPAGGQVF
jgi:hypothetical protein